MAVVRIHSEKITDWASFHEICKEAFGFPSFYGMNMDAFIDCLTYIDEGDGMSKVVLEGDEMLMIELLSSNEFGVRLPEVFTAFVESIEAVNQRSAQDGKKERIQLVML